MISGNYLLLDFKNSLKKKNVWPIPLFRSLVISILL